ncbi:hypothetical protein ACAW74_24420 [Fibrella sp. WM1]|uniref:hypothetical protein n=1 Tax=Fibrella musci TaxID=3242485 RepID=UPI003521BDE9
MYHIDKIRIIVFYKETDNESKAWLLQLNNDGWLQKSIPIFYDDVVENQFSTSTRIKNETITVYDYYMPELKQKNKQATYRLINGVLKIDTFNQK